MQKTLFRNLIAIFIQYRYRFAKSFAMLIISNILLIVNPLLFRQAVMALSEPDESNFFHKVLGNSVLHWAILLIFITLTSAFFKYWMRMGFIKISRDVERDLREKLFSRMQVQSRTFFDRHGIGELLSRLTNDITLYRDLLGPGVLYPLFFITIVFPGIIALFSISIPLAAISLVPLLLIPLLHATVRKKSYKLSQEVQSSLGILSNMTQEHFSGIRIIKSYAIERPTFERFSKLCKQFANTSLKMFSLQGIFAPLFTMITRITTVCLMLFSAYIILKSWGTLTPADFVAFMWLQSYVFYPVVMMGWVLPIYERGRAAYARLVEIYEEPIEVKDNPTSFLRIPHKANIEFKNLVFTYPSSNKTVLKNFNLHIEGGTFVGITGPVGAGKTTLLNLINREYEVSPNMVFIGEHEIHEYPLSAFRSQMINVEQASFLFSRSLAENVRFGRVEATQKELELVSQYADLHDAVMEFPEKYDTLVGERGITLSGGQKQRVAIARAFLVNRSILLLDDIFSAVDSATEKRIFASIKQHFSDRTILLVTHRVSILEQLDRVIYIVDGHVEEDGHPKILLKKKGYFAALAELQKLVGEISP